MRKGNILKKPLAFHISILISVCCLLVLMIELVQLPDSSPMKSVSMSSEDKRLSKLAEMMIHMLPQDLPFTVFVPCEQAFKNDLGLGQNFSLNAAKMDDTYALLSRVLGFSAVPRNIYSEMVMVNEEVSYGSLSGLSLYISKDVDGTLLVNRVRSKRVDINKGKIVVHIMERVIMDSEFERSVKPDTNDQ